jgi:hypothetical protein
VYSTATTTLLTSTPARFCTDTTEDPEEPLGNRGANAADTVGPSRDEMRPPKKK